MNDFRLEQSELKNSMLSAVNRVIDSGWYILGKEVDDFEKKWATLCQTKHGIGVGNGMDAIEIILRSLNIGIGDEVITTPMTAFATVLAIVRAGAKPVLADIDCNTALLSLESVERCITKKTKAILLVHLYGQVRNMIGWKELCIKNSLHLVEDCAQAHLAKWQNQLAGSFGIAGAYSFYPTKNLGAIGDAGIIITNSDYINNYSRRIRNYGQSERYHHPDTGLNSRLDEIQAAILSERLKWLALFTKRRKEIASRYLNEINNQFILQLSKPENEESHVYHIFVIKSYRREELKNFLLKNNIQTLIHYPVPIHQQPPFKDISKDRYGLKESESHSNICLSIPCHPQLTDDNIDYVIKILNSFK